MQLLQILRKPSLDIAITPQQKMLLIKVYAVYVLLIGAIYVGNMILESRRGEETAYDIAQSFVAQKLVLPSTVQFPPKSENGVTVQYLGEDRYSVSGYLHSKNTFGYEQRSDYTCIIRYVGGGEWIYEKITFE